MARMARIVIPNIPHHITQRGNRSQEVFFNDQNKASYLNLLHKQTTGSRKNDGVKPQLWKVIIGNRDKQGDFEFGHKAS